MMFQRKQSIFSLIYNSKLFVVFFIPFKLRVGGLWFIVPMIGIKSLISQLAVRDYWVKSVCVPQTKFKKCHSRSHIGYLENEFSY